MSSRRQITLKGFSSSPEKDQCTFCGRVVVAGPRGVSRHFARNPQCSLAFARDQNLLPPIHMSTAHQENSNNASSQSNSGFIRAINISSQIDKSTSSISQDHAVVCFPDKNVANDAFRRKDSPAAHDNLSDDDERCTNSPMNVALGQLPVLPMHESVPTHLPVDFFNPMSVLTRRLMMHLLLGLNPSTMGYPVLCFQWKRKFRLTSFKP